MPTTTLQLYQSLSYPSCGGTLLLALKLTRNLCAGEFQNQNSFIEQNGVDIVSNIIGFKELVNDSNYGIIRMGLQVLANVSLAGKEQQIAIWNRVYSLEFVEIAKLRRKEICDPLCMIIYACIEANRKLLDMLCSDHALPFLVEIVHTALTGDLLVALHLCPYKGFRGDIVAVIGNCAYRRKHVQDEIRDRDGILLMLQQCVTDDENAFLREWGIWCVRSLLEGNLENQKVVSELEIQGSVSLPELATLGLKVDVDQQTRRAKLVNTTS